MRPSLRPALALLAGVACASEQIPAPEATRDVVDTSGYTWALPAGFPLPNVPADNPMSEDKVTLGRYLFYDKRLSVNGTYSCASCHDQARAFTDGQGRAVGATGEVHPRGAMALGNVAYASALTWANPLQTQLEKQALVPMFGDAPVELGLADKDAQVLQTINADPTYQALRARAFPDAKNALALSHVTRALASFERSLISGDSAYDQWATGRNPDALSLSAQRGRDLFFGERTECFHCHGGFNFSDNLSHAGTRIAEQTFHNTALYNIDGKGAYPADNVGVLAITGNPEDMGRFKAPTLRNISVTAPYMHDGSIATLRDVIAHYASGGRVIATGPNAGVGAYNPYRSEFITGFTLTESETDDLIHFLESLTDLNFLSNPKHRDPWRKTP